MSHDTFNVRSYKYSSICKVFLIAIQCICRTDINLFSIRKSDIKRSKEAQIKKSLSLRNFMKRLRFEQSLRSQTNLSYVSCAASGAALVQFSANKNGQIFTAIYTTAFDIPPIHSSIYKRFLSLRLFYKKSSVTIPVHFYSALLLNN